MALAYRDVKDIYDNLKDAGVVTDTLPQWSDKMNELTKSDLYSAGLNDNFIKRSSVAIDRLIEAVPGLQENTARFGRAAGGLVGAPDTGEKIGEGLPRSVVNFAPLAVGALASGGLAVPAEIAGLAASGALSGAETYTESGSPAAGLVSGASAAALPGIAGYAERKALGAVGAKLVEGPIATERGIKAVSEYFPTIPQKLASVAAGQVAAGATMAATDVAQQKLAGEDASLDPIDLLLNMTLGAAPFGALHLAGRGIRAARGVETETAESLQSRVKATQDQIDLANVKAKLKAQQGSSVENLPKVEPTEVDPKVIEETQTLLSKIRGEQVQINENPNLAPEVKAKAVANLAEQEKNLTPLAPSDNTTVMADKPDASDRTQIVGYQLQDRTKSRIVHVADLPVNPPELRGKVVIYSKGTKEPEPQVRSDGTTVFGMAAPQWRTIKGTIEEWNATKPKPVDANQPLLPEQVRVMSDEELRDHMNEIAKVKAQADQAATTTDLAQATVRLNHVEDANGLPLTTDEDIKRQAALVDKSDTTSDPIKAAVKAQASKVERKLQALKQRQQDIQTGTLFRAEQEKLPEAADEIGKLHELEGQLSKSRSSYADALLGGELNRMYRDWVAGGRVGGFDAFRSEVGKAANKGKGLFRNQQVDAAVKSKTLETQPFGNIVDEGASVATHTPAALLAWEDYPNPDKPGYAEEAHKFQLLTKEFGTLKDVDPEEAAQLLFDDAGGSMTMLEAKEEVQDFLSRPYVKMWSDLVDQHITKIREGNSVPPGAKASFVPFTPDPVNQKPELDLMTEIGTTGHSAVKFLSTSSDPLYREIGKAFARFQDSLGRTTLRFGQTENGASYAYTNPEGSTITINPSAFDHIEHTVAHELVHALTAQELQVPTNRPLLDAFDKLRKELIDKLPPEQKAKVKQLIADGWYDKYVEGKADTSAISLNPTEGSFLYSFLDPHELVAQGITDPGLQSFMKSIPGAAPKQNFFSRFAKLVMGTLGFSNKVPESKFEEFLGLTGQLMQRGDFVSSFKDFGERYFENLGRDRAQASYDTQSALNVVSQVDTKSVSPDELLFKLNEHTGVYDDTPAGIALSNMIRQGGDDYNANKVIMDNLGYRMGFQPMEDFAKDLVSKESLMHDAAYILLPKAAGDFVNAKVQSMKDLVGLIKAATDEKNRGLINIIKPDAYRDALAQVEKKIARVEALRDDLSAGEMHIKKMQSIAPDGFINASFEPPDKGDKEKVEAFSRDSITAPKRGLAYWLQPLAQLVREDPRAAQLASKAFTLDANARQFQANALRVFGIDLNSGSSEINDKTVKAAIKTIQSPKTENAVNQWMFENNDRARVEDRPETLLPTSDPKIAAILSKLTEEEKQGVIDTVTKTGVMTAAVHQQILKHIEDISNTDGGIIAMLDQPVAKPEVAVEMAGRVFAALAVDRTDPQAAQVADAQLKVVQERMSPEGFLKLLQFMQGENQKYQAYKEFFGPRAYWATAQRQERYLVEFTRNGEKKQLQASSIKEANELAKGGINLQISDNLKGKNDEMPSLGPDTPALLARLRELQNTQDAVLKPMMSPEAWEKRQELDPVTQMAREIAATGGAPQFRPPPRKLSQGADELPWLWNHISWAQRQSNYWTRQLLRAQSRLYLSSPELVEAPDLQKRLGEHIENMLRPDPLAIQKVNRFASTWFMGFAPASALINGLQTISTLVPELTNISGKPVDSYLTWGKAVNEVTRHLFQGGGKVWNDPEIDQLMRAGEKAGQVGFSMWDDAAQAHETISNDYKRAMMKNKTQDTWQRLSSISGAWSTAAMWMFKNVEMFNQRVALVAAYRQARDMGLEPTDATKQAFEVNLSTNYGGGRAGRPTGLYSGKDQFSRGAAMLATNMQNYNLGVVSQISRYLQAGYFRPEGLKPSQVHAARLAATQMLGTQLAAAGLLGLPFVSGAIALVNQAFPQLEINKKLRETMDTFLGNDSESGSVLADAALTGLPSMLGWDMQSRLSWGNITPGVSEFNGFQPELLLGPPVNLVSNFVNGALKLAGGDPVGGQAFIPPGLKKLTQLIATGGTLKDYKDRPLFQPTAGETAGIALGFQPKRLSDFNAASRMEALTEQNSRAAEGQFHQQQAQDVLAGRFGTVRQALLTRSRDDKNFDAASAIRSIAQAAEDQTFPRDLRREGSIRTAPDQRRLLSAFSLPEDSATEVQRLKFRQGIQQRLGLPESNPSELLRANLMDQLRQQKPDALRSELGTAADQVLHSSRRKFSLLPALP